MTATKPTVLQALIGRARALYGDVTPCHGKTWEDCITYHRGRLVFWFNDTSGSTRTITV
jgi:hypothetical protein